jgi:ArsR family transcriptional regulator
MEMIDLVKAVKALSDETRLRMVNLLHQKECCVCEVMQVLKISQSRASRNLNLLRDAGFLSVRKDGLWSYYSIVRRSPKDPISLLLDAVVRGLKADPTGLKDLKNLKKARRLGQNPCSK